MKTQRTFGLKASLAALVAAGAVAISNADSLTYGLGIGAENPNNTPLERQKSAMFYNALSEQQRAWQQGDLENFMKEQREQNQGQQPTRQQIQTAPDQIPQTTKEQEEWPTYNKVINSRDRFVHKTLYYTVYENMKNRKLYRVAYSMDFLNWLRKHRVKEYNSIKNDIDNRSEECVRQAEMYNPELADDFNKFVHEYKSSQQK